MNLLLYLLERQKAFASSSAHGAGSLQWRINLAVRAVLAKVIAQVPAGTELSTHLNEVRDKFNVGQRRNHMPKKEAKKATQATAKIPKAAKKAQPNDNTNAVAERDAKRGIKFDADRIAALYKQGKKISEIAQAVGFPKGQGNNRVHAALVKAGVRQPRPAEK